MLSWRQLCNGLRVTRTSIGQRYWPMSQRNRQRASSIAVKQNHDIRHCRSIYWVLLDTQEADVDTFQHLGFRVLSVQGIVYHLYNISLCPVPPYLALVTYRSPTISNTDDTYEWFSENINNISVLICRH